MSKLTVKHEDKNGIKLQVGQIVKISNAYFKVDNGYYFIEHEPDAPNWLGSDYGLTRINSRTGKLTEGKNRIAFYPLCSFCSDQRKNAAADEWNEEHCEIEVITTIKNDSVVEFFKNELADKEKQTQRDYWNYGESSEIVEKDNIIIDYYKNVLETITTTGKKEIEEPTQNDTISKAIKNLEKEEHKHDNMIRLEGYGWRKAKKASNFVVGDVIIYNYGFKSTIIAIKNISDSTLCIVTTNEIGKTFERNYRKTTLLAYEEKINGYIYCGLACDQWERLYKAGKKINKTVEQIAEEISTKYCYIHSDIEESIKYFEDLAEKEQLKQTEPQEQAEPIEEQREQPTRIYYNINESLARAAKNANSFSEYKPGSATEIYKNYCDSVYDIAEEVKEKKPEQAEKASHMANRYAKKLADYYNSYYSNEASCPSILICGGGNFPTRKKEKQNARRDSLMKEWKELESYKEKIKNILSYNQIIKSGDADAVEQLKSKIEKLEQQQQLYKNANEAIRKNDNETLKKLGFTDAQIEELKKPDFCGRVGFPDYVLTNNNANIRRLKDRLKTLEKAKETNTASEKNELFTIIRNTDIMRLQLKFDGKPDEKTRNILKSNGFRWSPKNATWQRMLNNNSEYALKKVIEKLTA